MTKAVWYAQDNQSKLRPLVADPVFEQAVYVIFGEIMSRQIPDPDLTSHALMNSFREGVVWALAQFTVLSVTPTPRDRPKTLRPWQHAHEPINPVEDEE